MPAYLLLRPARLARVRTAGTPSRPTDRGPADVTAVAHDLRSPLVTVHAYLELLTEEAFGPISSEAREAAERATRAASRAQSLIDDTLRRYAIETAGRPLGAPEIDAAKLVDLGALLDGAAAATAALHLRPDDWPAAGPEGARRHRAARQ